MVLELSGEDIVEHGIDGNVASTSVFERRSILLPKITSSLTMLCGMRLLVAYVSARKLTKSSSTPCNSIVAVSRCLERDGLEAMMPQELAGTPTDWRCLKKCSANECPIIRSMAMSRSWHSIPKSCSITMQSYLVADPSSGYAKSNGKALQADTITEKPENLLLVWSWNNSVLYSPLCTQQRGNERRSLTVRS